MAGTWKPFCSSLMLASRASPSEPAGSCDRRRPALTRRRTSACGHQEIKPQRRRQRNARGSRADDKRRDVALDFLPRELSEQPDEPPQVFPELGLGGGGSNGGLGRADDRHGERCGVHLLLSGRGERERGRWR